MVDFTLLPAIALMAAAPDPPATVDIGFDGLRNARGLVHVCITRDRRHFPNCAGDPDAVRQTVPAATRNLRVARLPAGNYAITCFHDENANHRLDKMLGVPREGFCFSRNPVIRFGAPTFEKVVIQLGPGITAAQLRMKYLL